MYDYDNHNAPTNQNLAPFEISFNISKNSPLGVSTISIENVILYGDSEDEVYGITDLTGINFEIKLKLAESIKITGSDSVDKTTKYIAVISPDDTANKEVDWSVDNEDIAVISSDGTLIPRKNGTVTIIASTTDGSGKFDTQKQKYVQKNELLR